MNGERGVIFDMDGVLIDTYRAHYESWREVARAHGLQFTEQEFARVFGRTSRETIAAIWGRQQLDPQQIERLDEQKEAIFRQMIASQLPVMPGAEQLLRQLYQARFRLALGSSAPQENVQLIVEQMGIAPLLAAVVTRGDVRHGKPEPEVFLVAARRMGLAPRRCVVIEDAPDGIAAAHRAGMPCVGLASTGRTRYGLSAAELVVDRLDQLSVAHLARLIDSWSRDQP